MAHNETPQGLAADAAPDAGPPAPHGDAGPAPRGHVPERTCILTRAAAPREALIRLALSPDGAVLPDVRAKAPGRGAWIGVDRAQLETAVARGRLKGALARAFKAQAVAIPADLPAQIAAALERQLTERLGLEARAGHVLTGSDRIADAARAGRVHLLLHAADAAEDGSKKLDQAWRVGGGAPRGLVIALSRTILSVALGRDNVVHVALTDRAAAGRVRHALDRWHGFIGRNDATPPSAPARGPSSSDDEIHVRNTATP